MSRPEKTAEANVRVTIQRDLKKPKFNNERYTATVPENIEVGRNVDIKPGAVRGTDEDKKVCRNAIFRMTIRYLRQNEIFINSVLSVWLKVIRCADDHVQR